MEPSSCPHTMWDAHTPTDGDSQRDVVKHGTACCSHAHMWVSMYLRRWALVRGRTQNLPGSPHPWRSVPWEARGGRPACSCWEHFQPISALISHRRLRGHPGPWWPPCGRHSPGGSDGFHSLSLLFGFPESAATVGLSVLEATGTHSGLKIHGNHV